MLFDARICLFEGTFDGVRPEIFMIAGISLLVLDGIIAFFCGKGKTFTALALFTSGCTFLPALVSPNFSDMDTAIYGLILVTLGSFVYLLLSVSLKWKTEKRAKKEKLVQERRKAVFTLPDRENSFVRDRLNGSLRVEEEAVNEREYNLEDGKLRLNHVRDMLTKLKAAPLSAGDRLETEEISRLITLYATKERLTAKEIRDLNDCLSAILKMTAKYAL